MENRDRDIIRGLFETFVKAWESTETDILDEIMLPDCEIDFSIFEKGIDRAGLKEALAVRTRTVTYTRFEAFNFVCRIAGSTAQQSATVSGLFADEAAEKPANFAFSAKMVNTFAKTKDGWKFCAMKLELAGQSDNHSRLCTGGVSVGRMDGDPSFIENWRQIPLEVGWHEGSRLLSVIPEIDAPWYAVPERDDQITDEEQIKEVLYRYCFALDFDCVELYEGVFSTNAIAVYNTTRQYDKRSVTEMLRFERAGGIGSHHILYIAPGSLKIDGDTATAHIYRSELDFVPAKKILYGEDKKKNWLLGRYDLKFTKEEGNWYIDRLNYYQGYFEGPRSEDVFICSSGN